MVMLVSGLLSIAARADKEHRRSSDTETPITYRVVVFQENASLDHNFATYPDASNRPGESVFTATT